MFSYLHEDVKSEINSFILTCTVTLTALEVPLHQKRSNKPM